MSLAKFWTYFIFFNKLSPGPFLKAKLSFFNVFVRFKQRYPLSTHEKVNLDAVGTQEVPLNPVTCAWSQSIKQKKEKYMNFAEYSKKEYQK